MKEWAESKIDQKLTDDHHTKRFRQAPTPSPSTSSPSALASSSSPPAASTRRNNEKDKDDSFVILIGGFPRELPKPALLAHWDSVELSIPNDMSDNVTVQAGHGKKAYGIKFPTLAAAIRFSSHTRDNPTTISWTDPRTGTATEGMWARFPKTVEEDEVGKIFSAGYELLRDRLKASSNWSDAHKLQTDRRKGRIAVHTETDFWVLITLEGPEREVDMKQTELAYFGVLPTETETIRDSITAAVKARRPAAGASA